MALLTLIASHHDVDLDLLERLTAAGTAGSAVAADASITGCVVLATCNRFELYLDSRDPGVAQKAAVQAVAEAAGLTLDEVSATLQPVVGERGVAEHLFSVASGLESMVVGEREITGQVRRALDAARADGTTTTALERLFQTASRASRAVVARTGLGRTRSLVAVALELAAQEAPLVGARVLLVGTGSYARTAIGALRAQSVGQIVVHSASGRAGELAEALDLDVAGALADELAAADVVVGCSGTAGYVIGVEDLRTAMARSGGPAVLVDLALRHDVDPAVRELGVPLIDLATVRRHVELPEVAQARGVVADEAEEFAAGLAEAEVVPAVVALRGRVHELLEEELCRVPGGPAPEVEAALRHFAARLLHGPVVRAREEARAGHADAYRDAIETLLGREIPDPRDD